MGRKRNNDNEDDDGIDWEEKLKELDDTHLHTEDEMNKIHEHFRDIFFDTNHADLFNKTKAHIAACTLKAVEHERVRLNVIQQRVEAAITSLEFDKEQVEKNPNVVRANLQSLVNDVESILVSNRDRRHHIDREMSNARSVVERNFPPGWFSRAGRNLGNAAMAVASAPFRIAAAPFKLISGAGRKE